ncbi:MAG: hypothetical protein R3A10_07575 [Caldilineaceae bacterium]
MPVDRLKIGLFMTTATAAWLVAIIQLTVVKSADTLRGEGQEFIVIIAAVIGGNLLQRLRLGRGRAGGAHLRHGAPGHWFLRAWTRTGLSSFCRDMLIIAVLVNNYIRQAAEKARR